MTKTKKIVNRTSVLKLILLVIWIASVAYIVFSGGVALIFHPQYHFLPVVGLAFLLILLVWTIMNLKVEIPVDDSGFPTSEYNWSAHQVLDPLQRLALFLVPPLFLLVFGVQVLDTSSEFGNNKSSALIEAAARASGLDLNSNVARAEYAEISQSDMYSGELNKLLEKKVRLKGIYTFNEAFEEDQFGVGRMYIPCCAACAYPVVMMAIGKRPEVEKGQWVGVYGVLKRIGADKWYIEVEHAIPINKPANPYVY